MFYNIKTKDVRANGRGRGRAGTPYYIIRARVKDGVGGIDGVNGGGLTGKGLRDGKRGAGLLSDGGNTFTREGKGGYKGGEKEKKGEGEERKGRYDKREERGREKEKGTKGREEGKLKEERKKLKEERKKLKGEEGSRKLEEGKGEKRRYNLC